MCVKFCFLWFILCFMCWYGIKIEKKRNIDLSNTAQDLNYFALSGLCFSTKFLIAMDEMG